MTLIPEPTEGFVVATDDPGHPGVVLFLVDRRKEKRSFWSFSLTSAFILATKEVADFHVSMLKYNKPRVLNWEQAQAALEANQPHIQSLSDV